MVKSFKHRGLQRFFEKGSKAGIQAAHAPKLARQLRQLNDAARPEDMDRLESASVKRARSERALVGVGQWQLAIDLRVRRPGCHAGGLPGLSLGEHNAYV